MVHVEGMTPKIFFWDTHQGYLLLRIPNLLYLQQQADQCEKSTLAKAA
jgi:hypothetical protein